MGKQTLPLAPGALDCPADFRTDVASEMAAQAPRKGRAAALGGNRDRERAPAEDGRIVKVAELGIVHDVHENPAAPRQARDALV